MNYLDNLLFGFYPYICLTVFLLGSLIRFDQNQYSWKSDSSQLLRAGLHALAALDASALAAALDRLEPIKTGRPRKGH